jgi:2-polyprenyl-3-methyl-5-hydroxy-6-metoxy-1,4-benzoquinol methylase
MHRPDTQATKEHWDTMAEGYDAAKQRNDAYYSALKGCFDRAVPQRARGRVLDVGCGTGQVLAALRPTEGVGIDLSERMIEEAKARFANRHELVFAAMDAAGARGLGEFDAVISADVMEHVNDWEAVVDAMMIVCRVGGTIAITTPSPRWTFPLWLLEKLKLKMPEGPHRFVAGRRIAQRMRHGGCEVTHCGTHAMLPISLGGIGERLSNVAAELPLLRGLGVIQLIVAVKTHAVT